MYPSPKQRRDFGAHISDVVSKTAVLSICLKRLEVRLQAGGAPGPVSIDQHGEDALGIGLVVVSACREPLGRLVWPKAKLLQLVDEALSLGVVFGDEPRAEPCLDLGIRQGADHLERGGHSAQGLPKPSRPIGLAVEIPPDDERRDLRGLCFEQHKEPSKLPRVRGAGLSREVAVDLDPACPECPRSVVDVEVLFCLRAPLPSADMLQYAVEPVVLIQQHPIREPGQCPGVLRALGDDAQSKWRLVAHDGAVTHCSLTVLQNSPGRRSSWKRSQSG